MGTLASAIVPGFAVPVTGTIIDIEDFNGRLHIKVQHLKVFAAGPVPDTILFFLGSSTPRRHMVAAGRFLSASFAV